MNVEDIKDMIAAKGFRGSRRTLERNYDQLVSLWKFSQPPSGVAEITYCVVNDVVDFPLCLHGKPAKFARFYNDGFLQSCTDYKTCGCFRAARAARVALNPMTPEQVEKRNAKYRATMLDRYGVENSFQLEEIKDKTRATNLERYGVEYISQNAEIRKKVEATNLERYGDTHAIRTDAVQAKVQETNLARYGVRHSIASDQSRKKAAATNLERYGVENVFNSPAFQKQASRTIWDRFGVENIGQIHLSDATKAVVHNREPFIEFCTGKNFEEVADELGDISAVQIGVVARKFDCVEVFAFGKGSKYQSQCERFVTGMGLEYKRNSRSIIPPKEIDIWLPGHKIGIEIDGLYYHSEIIGRKSQHYHADKQDAADACGVRLIQIYTDEWIHKRAIVETMIRRNLSMHDPEVIPARKCQIELIPWAEASEFLNSNHLQGGGASTRYNYGLRYGGRLVALMTVALNRKSTSTQGWELVRWCEDGGSHVIGGASRLFRHIVKTHDIDAIDSFSDRRYFSGRVYGELGFTQNGITRPGYHYTDFQHRYNRFNFTKAKLVERGHDPELSEWQIMQTMGYDRVWDSGQIRWRWKK